MKILRPLAALLLLIATAPARLGDTGAQCTEQYGKPVGAGDEHQLVYEKDGLQILVNFYNGRADYLAFSRVNLPGAKARPLSNEEIARVLEANRGGETWTAKPAGDGHRIWTARTRYAEVDSAGELIVMFQEYPRTTDHPRPRDRSKD